MIQPYTKSRDLSKRRRCPVVEKGEELLPPESDSPALYALRCRAIDGQLLL
jgi:hypothetical protein